MRRHRHRRRALAAMARDRARRADPQGPRHFLDPAAHLQQAHLCRPRRLRHRDRGDRDAGRLTPIGLFFARAACHHSAHGATRSLSCHRRRDRGRRLRARGFRRANCRASPTSSPSAIPVDVELVIAVDVSYSMDPDEQALQREGYVHGADLARIHAGAARGRQRQDRHHLFRMGRPVRPEDHHAVAADRRPGIGRRGRRRDRARALPARLAHLDFRRACVSPSRCSTTAAIAACAA